MSWVASLRRSKRIGSTDHQDDKAVKPALHIPPEGPLSKATISAIIPLYNHAHYIGAALESILAQTSAVDEIVLVDDGSSDDGFERAQQILGHRPNTILHRQENADAYNALNHAISLSHGDYLAVLNSDDMFSPGKIERCRRILADQADTQMIIGEISFMDGQGKPYHKMDNWMQRAYRFLDETRSPQLAQLNRHFAFTTSNMVFSRNLWQAADGFQKLRYCHDLDFLMFAYGYGKLVFDRGYEHTLYRRHTSNTVKENARKVNIEVAAIMAHIFKTSGPDLLSSALDEADFDAFRQVLARRKMSDLILFFMTIGKKFSTRAELYAYATDPHRSPMFRDVLG